MLDLIIIHRIGTSATINKSLQLCIKISWFLWLCYQINAKLPKSESFSRPLIHTKSGNSTKPWTFRSPDQCFAALLPSELSKRLLVMSKQNLEYKWYTFLHKFTPTFTLSCLPINVVPFTWKTLVHRWQVNFINVTQLLIFCSAYFITVLVPNLPRSLQT